MRNDFSIVAMPLEPPDQQYWSAAIGFVELGMFQDANAELEKIDPSNRAAPQVLVLRIAVYCGLENWELMVGLTKRLTEFQPDDFQWPVSLAYATRRASSIEAAKEILLNAESQFPKQALIKYNLACYFCQTGDIENAKIHLKKAFKIDLSWRITALDDPDLQPLWKDL
jgi:tetratricopeptide (TPR) repeat protein